MKYVKISLDNAIKYGYLDPEEQWEGKELLIGEDGYAYIDDVAMLPIRGSWDLNKLVWISQIV